jgi:hypothetical protein
MKSSHAAAATSISRFLNDDYVAVPSPEQRRLECRLLQRQPWQDSEAELELFNGHYLAVRDRRRPELAERVINLAYLDPRPDYHCGDIVSRLLLTSLASLLVLVTVALLQPQAILMAVLAVTCLLLLAFMSASPGCWVFNTALGGIPVCSVSRGLLRLARPRHFVDMLAERAEGAQVILPKGSKRLAAELAEHRRMLESGTLSRRHYESARERLLARRKAAGTAQSEVQLA